MFTLSQLIDGFTLAQNARRLSEHTIADYSNTFRKLQRYLGGDPAFISITRAQIEGFLASQQDLSKKTVLNYHTGLSALWSWACAEGYASQNPLRQIERPKPEKRVIQPFSESDLRSLLNALARSKSYRNHGTLSDHSLPNQDRNRAILLLLIDTGLRAEELCQAKVADFDPKNRLLKVFGKGDRERILPLCARTAQMIWKYLAPRDAAPHEFLFMTEDQTPFDRNRLYKQLAKIGKRANVSDVHPHRFRHTFAIQFLRNGGNVYTLQMLLGHSTLDMCKKYLSLAQVDVQSAHRLASPVARMRL